MAATTHDRRRTVGRFLGVLTVAITGLAMTPDAHAASYDVAVGTRFLIASSSPVTFDVWSPSGGALWDVQSSTTPATAGAPSDVWRDVATTDDSASYDVGAPGGSVLCVRARADDGTAVGNWTSPTCALVPIPSRHLSVTGVHAWTRKGAVLGADGRLSGPHVDAGSSVYALYDGRYAGNYDTPQEGVLRQTESPDALVPDSESVGYNVHPYELGHHVGAGTAAVWGTSPLGTAPVSGLAIQPSWLTFPDQRSPGPTPSPQVPYVGGWSHPETDAEPTDEFTWEPSYYPGIDLEMQVRSASFDAPAPTWTWVNIDESSSGRRFTLRPGWTTCVRLREVSKVDQSASRWTLQDCETRAVDDSQLTYVGAHRPTHDPRSLDGQATVLSPGTRAYVGKVQRGSQLGFLFFPRNRQDLALLDLQVRGGAVSGDRYGGTYAATPLSKPGIEELSQRVRRGGSAYIVGLPPENLEPNALSALFVQPPWSSPRG